MNCAASRSVATTGDTGLNWVKWMIQLLLVFGEGAEPKSFYNHFALQGHNIIKSFDCLSQNKAQGMTTGNTPRQQQMCLRLKPLRKKNISETLQLLLNRSNPLIVSGRRFNPCLCGKSVCVLCCADDTL